jgi:hypothetical protein
MQLVKYVSKKLRSREIYPRLRRVSSACPEPTLIFSDMAAMQLDKLDVDSYLATAASSAPSELHPFFEKFRRQHERK